MFPARGQRFCSVGIATTTQAIAQPNFARSSLFSKWTIQRLKRSEKIPSSTNIAFGKQFADHFLKVVSRRHFDR
jgi:hypothetical protein